MIVGVDEAGRGALCGPVVAAAVALPDGKIPIFIRDSKRLSTKQREAMFFWIQAHCIFSVGMCSAAAIDRINIFQATMCAMVRAVYALPCRPTHVLVDGNKVPQALQTYATAHVGGDASIPAISAASIVAKVTRDRILVALDTKYPNYGFAVHKGYGTVAHRVALRRFGPTECHRHSFRLC